MAQFGVPENGNYYHISNHTIIRIRITDIIMTVMDIIISLPTPHPRWIIPAVRGLRLGDGLVGGNVATTSSYEPIAKYLAKNVWGKLPVKNFKSSFLQSPPRPLFLTRS